jgi:hypothetical protein
VTAPHRGNLDEGEPTVEGGAADFFAWAEAECTHRNAERPLPTHDKTLDQQAGAGDAPTPSSPALSTPPSRSTAGATAGAVGAAGAANEGGVGDGDAPFSFNEEGEIDEDLYQYLEAENNQTLKQIANEQGMLVTDLLAANRFHPITHPAGTPPPPLSLATLPLSSTWAHILQVLQDWSGSRQSIQQCVTELLVRIGPAAGSRDFYVDQDRIARRLGANESRTCCRKRTTHM